MDQDGRRPSTNQAARTGEGRLVLHLRRNRLQPDPATPPVRLRGAVMARRPAFTQQQDMHAGVDSRTVGADAPARAASLARGRRRCGASGSACSSDRPRSPGTAPEPFQRCCASSEPWAPPPTARPSEYRPEMRDRVPLRGRRHHFFVSRSFRPALSNIASASSRSSRAFSSSSARLRLFQHTDNLLFREP